MTKNIYVSSTGKTTCIELTGRRDAFYFVSKNAEMTKLVQNHLKALPVQCISKQSVQFHVVSKKAEMTKLEDLFIKLFNHIKLTC